MYLLYLPVFTINTHSCAYTYIFVSNLNEDGLPFEQGENVMATWVGQLFHPVYFWKGLSI